MQSQFLLFLLCLAVPAASSSEQFLSPQLGFAQEASSSTSAQSTAFQPMDDDTMVQSILGEDSVLGGGGHGGWAGYRGLSHKDSVQSVLGADAAARKGKKAGVGFTQQKTSSSVSAQSTAKLWLSSHSGTPDELAELKSVNPNAYAIVKALLTKRSLGLLDSKRPTASFANGDGSPVLRAAHPQLALAAQKLAVTHADVQPATHHDWFNWKANAMDDETMVQNVLGADSVENVLGAAAELKGKKAGLGFAQESSSSVSAQSTARLWLSSHSGSPDELAELKSVNPNAYAIVKALLTKRSLGLLDSKRPTASFANGDGSPVSRAAHPQLALASQKLAVTYADVQPATHHDWFNWKANAMDDETMVQNVLGADSVQNVLGAAAELRGKKAGLAFIQQILGADSVQNVLGAAAELKGKKAGLGFAQESSSSSSAQSTARLWLSSHSGTPDELAELKSVNPNAYAIVKALLTKRSLGLLDSKRPTASFANGDGSPVSRAAHPQLALTSQKLAVNYGEVQPATHHDWFNWKANAMDDETMVQNVLGADSVQNALGAATELEGKKLGL